MAMRYFLEEYYKRTTSEDIAFLLGDLQALNGQNTADPAAWNEWLACVHKAIDNE
jgi:hypothetical protein